MSTESEMRRMVDEHAIERLLKTYNRCLDDRRIADLVTLFTADCRLKAGGKETFGRDSMIAFFGPQTPARATGQHVLTNVLAEIDGDEAKVVSDFTFVRRDAAGVSAIVLAGRYFDTVVRTSEGWLIKDREANALGRAQA